MAEDKNKTLKRGLSALLGEEASSSGEIQNALFSRIDKISPSRFQARTDISTENLEDLAASIRSQGVIQPLIVRKTASGEFELVVIVNQNTFKYCNLIFVDHGQLIIGESTLIFKARF